MMRLNEALLKWYDENARVLPWRGETDVYRIWLSEIMLQQTRTETVEGYYRRFLERFPDVHALAAADEDEVLKLWEGLGYYSRARNLHRAAKAVDAAGGRFPTDAEGLQTLPGVGPYAACAIASIACGECVPALDGNQMRVLSRALGIDRVLKTPFELLEEAQAEMSSERPGDYNQALMDLGARICKPKNPACGVCPLAFMCRAYAEEDPERYPVRPAPIPKRELDRTILLIETDAGIAIRKRPDGGLLGGLYEFPAIEENADADVVRAYLNDSEILRIEPLLSAKHVFTHLVWHMRGWHVYLSGEIRLPEGAFFANADDIRARAFPSAMRVYREAALEILDSKNTCQPLRDMLE